MDGSLDGSRFLRALVASLVASLLRRLLPACSLVARACELVVPDRGHDLGHDFLDIVQNFPDIPSISHRLQVEFYG